MAHGDDESVYLSGKKKDEIESEIKFFLDTGLGRAENLLKDHENELHKAGLPLSLRLHRLTGIIACISIGRVRNAVT